MTMKEWIQLLVPVIGVIAAIVSAALTYYFSKRKEVLSAERRLKEKFYLEFINALSSNVLTKDKDNAKSILARASNNILLIGSVDVVIKLRIFEKYIGPSNKENFNQREHDILLTELIKSMRNDLYKNKAFNKRAVNKGYPTVGVIGKNRRDE